LEVCFVQADSNSLQSAQAVRLFFDSEKVEAYFDRATPVQWEVVISVEVGALIAELYAKDHMFVADDPQVRLIKALQLVDCCRNDDRGEGGVEPHYSATISSRAYIFADGGAGQERALSTRQQMVLTSVGALCVTSFLPCGCLRTGLRP
jgi:hypothetical protein